MIGNRSKSTAKRSMRNFAACIFKKTLARVESCIESGLE